MSNTSSDVSDKLRALAAPFNHNDVSWVATTISHDRKAIHFVPYVAPEVYRRRLNNLPGTWSCKSRILPRNVSGTAGRVIAECVLTLPGLGVYRSTASVPVDADRAQLRSRVKAFKTACAKIGLGTYLRGLWVAIDLRGEPKCIPEPPALKSTYGLAVQRATAQPGEIPRSGIVLPNIAENRSRGVNRTIEALRKEVGEALYVEAVRLTRPASGRREFPLSKDLRLLGKLMAIARGIREAKSLASRIPDWRLHGILDDHGASGAIPTVAALVRIVSDLRKAVAS